MHRTIALTTALSVLGLVTASPAEGAVLAELLVEEHFTEAGYEVTRAVTRDADGDVLHEMTLVDPASEDTVDFWLDGGDIRWAGTVDGQPVEGSMRAREVQADPEESFCFTPYTAIICIGVILIASSASCATTSNACPPRDPSDAIPGGAGGVPEPGGGSEGGDDGGSGQTGGGDAE